MTRLYVRTEMEMRSLGEALAITLWPAEILGVDSRVGSLKEGKDADLVVWTGHPFDLKTDVAMTLIDGKKVYEKQVLSFTKQKPL